MVLAFVQNGWFETRSLMATIRCEEKSPRGGSWTDALANPKHWLCRAEFTDAQSPRFFPAFSAGRISRISAEDPGTVRGEFPARRAGIGKAPAERYSGLDTNDWRSSISSTFGISTSSTRRFF